MFGQIPGPNHINLHEIDVAGLGLEGLQIEAIAIRGRNRPFDKVDCDVRVLFHEPGNLRLGVVQPGRLALGQ